MKRRASEPLGHNRKRPPRSRVSRRPQRRCAQRYLADFCRLPSITGSIPVGGTNRALILLGFSRYRDKTGTKVLLRCQRPHLIVIAHHHRQISHECLDDLAWRAARRDERGLRWQRWSWTRNLNRDGGVNFLELNCRHLGSAAGDHNETNWG